MSPPDPEDFFQLLPAPLAAPKCCGRGAVNRKSGKDDETHTFGKTKQWVSHSSEPSSVWRGLTSVVRASGFGTRHSTNTASGSVAHSSAAHQAKAHLKIRALRSVRGAKRVLCGALVPDAGASSTGESGEADRPTRTSAACPTLRRHRPSEVVGLEQQENVNLARINQRMGNPAWTLDSSV
jgi:hypothetical protein